MNATCVLWINKEQEHAVNWSIMNIHCKMKSSPRNIYISILLKTLWIWLFFIFYFFSTYRPDFLKKKSVNQLIKKKCLTLSSLHQTTADLKTLTKSEHYYMFNYDNSPHFDWWSCLLCLYFRYRAADMAASSLFSTSDKCRPKNVNKICVLLCVKLW